MNASFSLRGDAKNGELDLYSPLGTTLGALQWTPHVVQLSDGGKHQYFSSLAELTEKPWEPSSPSMHSLAGCKVVMCKPQAGKLICRPCRKVQSPHTAPAPRPK